MIAFQFFYPIPCEFYMQFYESNTKTRHSFIPNHIKVNMQTCLAKAKVLENLLYIVEFGVSAGGFIERGLIYSLAQRHGAY